MDFTGKEGAEVAPALGAALFAAIADWRHRRRDDLDRVARFDWHSVQVFALIAAIVAFSFAMNL